MSRAFMSFAIVISAALFAVPAAAIHTPQGDVSPAQLGIVPELGDPVILEYKGAPTVGEERTFWAWDFSDMPPQDVEITATCRGVGDTVYVFVENDRWNADMDQDDVDAILEAMDDATPAGSYDPEMGIVDIESEVFAEIPDELDGDPKIYLLYYDMGDFGGYRFDGYFRADDQGTGPHSNQVEILYINPMHNDPGGEYLLAVGAHELNHLIQWGVDPSESGWLSEAFSELAMILCGYYTDQDHVSGFAAAPESPLIPDGPYEVDYGAVLLYSTYIYEQFGLEFIQDLFSDDADGQTAVENALYDAGNVLSFGDLFVDWAIANVLDADDDFLDGLYGYIAIDLPDFNRLAYVESLPASEGGTLNGWGTHYYDVYVEGLQALKAEVSSDSKGGLGVALISFEGDAADDPVQVKVDYEGAEIAVNIPEGALEATVVVAANDRGEDIDYTLELDESEPVEDDDDDDGDDDDDDDSGCCG